MTLNTNKFHHTLQGKTCSENISLDIYIVWNKKIRNCILAWHRCLKFSVYVDLNLAINRLSWQNYEKYLIHYMVRICLHKTNWRSRGKWNWMLSGRGKLALVRRTDSVYESIWFRKEKRQLFIYFALLRLLDARMCFCALRQKL